MRYRLLASYQGAQYEAGVSPEETGVVLFAACPPPEALGFEPATGHWRKQVDRIDVQTLYESRPVGMFRGERCVVLDDLTDRLHIAYLGHDAHRAEQLGYWEVDRGVFELITPRQEVTEIVEQRLQVAAPGDSTPYPPAAPVPSGFGYDAEQANGSRPHLPPSDLLAGLDGLGSDHSPLDDYLQDFPQYGGPGGRAGRRPDEFRPNVLGPADSGHLPTAAADAPPLPLEAEAMRAASAATRKAKMSQPAPAGDQGTVSGVPAGGGFSSPATAAGATPPVPTSPAGLSEPSGTPSPGSEGATAVPSWTPQPVAPQPAAPQPAAPQPVAPQPTTEQPAATQPTVLPGGGPMDAPPSLAMPSGPLPVLDDAAIHGVPLPAPVSVPRDVPPAAGLAEPASDPAAAGDHAPFGARIGPSGPRGPGVNLQRGTGFASGAAAAAAAADQPTAEPFAGTAGATNPAARGTKRAAQPKAGPEAPSPGAPALQTEQTMWAAQARRAPQGQLVSPGAQATVAPATHVHQTAQAGSPATARPAPDPADSSSPAGNAGFLPSRSASAGGTGMPVSGPSPPYGPAPYATPDPSGQVNGTYHGGEAHAPSPPAGTGLPRDQFERPPSGMTGGTPATASHVPGARVPGDQMPGGPVPANPVPANPALAKPAPASHVPGHLGIAGHGEAVNGFAAPAPQAYAAAPAAPVGAPGTAGVAAGIAAGGAIAVSAPYAPAAPDLRPAQPPAADQRSEAAEAAEAQPASRRRRASRRRQPTQRIFSELAEQAGIPQGAYAINEDVDGAMCLVRTSEGFEVFNSLAGARHEVRIFQDEESAYFYLFGVLAADAVRTGVLGPTR